MEDFYRVRQQDSSLVVFDTAGAANTDYEFAKAIAITESARSADLGHLKRYYVYYYFRQSETGVGYAINGEWCWR